MSNSLAIAAVTAALYDILIHVKDPIPGADTELADTEISAKAPDVARATEDHNQVNIFLYQTQLSSAWRNQDLPGRSHPGETATPPLALKLLYLITAYGRQGDDLLTHRVLGRAMSLLGDQAALGTDLLAATVVNHAYVRGNDLNLQVERVRITPQPLSLEDVSKLWTMFQTKYRVSVAYEVSVVLIDSTRPVVAPLPVLTRGAQDRGALVMASALLPYPSLRGFVLPGNKPVAYLGVKAAAAPAAVGLAGDLPGDSVTLVGQQLAGAQLVVHLQHPLRATPYDITSFTAADSAHVQCTLPDDQQGLPAGIATVYIERIDGGSDPEGSALRATNILPLPIAPRLLKASPSSTAAAAPGVLTVICSPQILPQQRVSLLVGSREIIGDGSAGPTSQLSFDLSSAGLQKGVYPLRLRVDGVDSQLIDYATTPASFAANSPRLELT